MDGIGACTNALRNLEIPYEIVDYVEIDKYAVKSYNAIYGTNFEPQDICDWDKDISADLIMHGSPCQDISIAGKQAGADKDAGTRSSLMYETIRIVKKIKPKIIIWENVKNILSEKHKHNFDAYLNEMETIGYDNYYQVLNAKDYSIPQNRERIFTISIRSSYKFRFKSPPKQELKLKLKDLLEDKVDEKYYLNNSYHMIDSINSNIIGKLDIKGIDQIKRIYSSEGISPTLTNMQGGNRQPKILEPIVIASRGRYKENGETEQHLEPNFTGTTNTITTVQKDNYIYKNCRIRKLTPRECWRLMGFSDKDFNKAEKVNSNTQLYKQAGNSIVVNVLEAIFKNLF